MEQLHQALRTVIDNLGELVDVLDSGPNSLNNRHRRVIELELRSLHELDRELTSGSLTRRSWSLGQASIPILNAMLKAVQRSTTAIPNQMTDQARQAISDLARALNQAAEGRE